MIVVFADSASTEEQAEYSLAAVPDPSVLLVAERTDASPPS